MDRSGMLPSSSIGVPIAVLERAAALHAPHPVVVVNITSSSSESDEGKEREKKKKKKSKKKRKSHREEKKKRKGRDDSEERGRKKKRQKSDDSDERRGRKKRREDSEDSGEGRERKKRREEKDAENCRQRDVREKDSVERRRSDGEERGHDSERRGERERRSAVVNDLDLERRGREGAGATEQSIRDNDKPVLHKHSSPTNVRPKDDEAEVHSPVLPPGVAAEEHLRRNNDSHQRPDSDSSLGVVFDCCPPIPLPPDRPAEDGRGEENHDPLPPVPPSSELKKKSENANEELLSMMKDMVHWKCKANVLRRQVDQQKNEMSQLQNKVLSSEQDKLGWVNAYNSLKVLSDRDKQTHENTITELRGQVTKLEGQVAEQELENTLHRTANETICFDNHALENEKKELERENAQLIAEKEELERKLNGRGETTSYNRVDPQYRAREPTREPSSQCVGIIPDYSSDMDHGTTRATRSRTPSRDDQNHNDMDYGTPPRDTRSRTPSRENHKFPERGTSPKANRKTRNRDAPFGQRENRSDEQPSGSKSGPLPQLNNNNENSEPVAASMVPVPVPQRPQPRPVASQGQGQGGRQWMGNNAPVYPCTLAPVYHPELGGEDYQQVPSVSHRSNTEQTTSHSRPVPPNMNASSSSSHPHVSTGSSDTLAPAHPLPSAPYTVVFNGQVIRYNRRPPPRRRLGTSGPNGQPTQPVVQNGSVPPVAPLARREVPLRTGSSMASGAGPREEVHSPDSTTVSSEVPHHQIEPTPEPVEKAAKPHRSLRPRLQTTAPGTGGRPPPRGQARTAGGRGDESSKVKNVSRRSVSFVDPNDLPPLPANQDSFGRRVGPPRRGGRPTNPAPAGILKKKPTDVAAQNAPDVFTSADPQTSIKRTSTSAKKPVTERVE